MRGTGYCREDLAWTVDGLVFEKFGENDDDFTKLQLLSSGTFAVVAP